MIPSTTKCQESLVLSMFPGDIGGLILYLGFWGLDLAIWSKKQMRKKKEKPKKEETVHCLRGANPVVPQGEGPPRGNSRDFFFAFWDVMGNPMNGTENNDKTKK